jgi:hypothetical protein
MTRTAGSGPLVTGARVSHRDHGLGTVNRVLYLHGKTYFRVTWDDATSPAQNSVHPQEDFE